MSLETARESKINYKVHCCGLMRFMVDDVVLNTSMTCTASVDTMMVLWHNLQ